MTGIYKITNKVTGESYIGQSIDIHRRFMEHRAPSGRTSPLKQAMQQYGKENFEFSVLEECAACDLDNREKHWIAALNPQYNVAAGGKGPSGRTVPEDMREHLSRKNKQHWASLPENEKAKIISRLSGPMKGHVVTAATREKLRVANTGKTQSAETIERRKATMRAKKAAGWECDRTLSRNKVRCVETGQVFESVKAAGDWLCMNPSGVSSVLTGRQKTCKGFHFEFVV